MTRGIRQGTGLRRFLPRASQNPFPAMHLKNRLPSFARFLLLGPLACACLAAESNGASSARFVRADSPEILVEGRTATSPEGGLLMGFPGVTLHLKFEGSDLGFRVKASSNDVYFDVSVDGAAPLRLQAKEGEGLYPLFHSATPGVHRISIVRRTESWEGVCEVQGFELGQGGRLLAPDPLPTRKLEFIGDSITCGSSIDVRPGEPQLGNQRSDANLTFAMELGRRFHAQVYLVSYGGRGVIRDWQGIRDTNNAPQFYERALPDDPKSHWDPRRYVPDAIGICLGTNDFNQGIPDQNEFVNAYVEFVRKVRRDAPNAWIFLIGSPIVWDEPGKPPRGSVLNAYIAEVVQKLDDPRVEAAPVHHYPGHSYDAHPTAAEHQAMATELEPRFRKALGW